MSSKCGSDSFLSSEGLMSVCTDVKRWIDDEEEG